MKTIEQYIEEYYSNITLKTLDDYKAAIDASIKNSEFRYYNSIINPVYQPTPDATTLNKIVNFTQDNKLSCFESFRHSASNPLTLMGMFNLAVEMAAKGYTPLVQKDDHKYEYAFKGTGAKQFVMRKPKKMQTADLKAISEGIKALYIELMEEDNTRLLDAEKAMSWATEQHAMAEAERTEQLKKSAIENAEKTIQIAAELKIKTKEA